MTFFQILMFIIFPFLFAVAFELIAGKKEKQALKAGAGAFLGFLFSFLLKFTMGCAMIGLFVWTVLF